MKKKAPRYLFITGFKGLAIVFIVAFHLQFIYSGFPEYINKFLAFSSVWINPFLILSAFTLTNGFVEERYNNFFSFMKRRFLRIAPPYYLLLIVAFFLWPLMTPSFRYIANFPILVQHLFFLNTAPIDQANQVRLLGIEWYVPVQFWLYVILPFVLFFLNQSVVVYVVLLLIAVVLHWEKNLLFHYKTVFDFASSVQNFLWLYIMAIGIRVLKNKRKTLALGLLLGFLVFLYGIQTRSEQMYITVAFLLVYWRIFIVEAVIAKARNIHQMLAVCIDHIDVAILFVMLYKYVLNWYFVKNPHEFMAFWSFAIIVAGYARPWVLRKLLENRILTIIGEYSYEVFLSHYMIITAVGYIIPKQGPYVRTLLILPITAIVSYLLRRFVSKPALKFSA